MAPTVLLGTLTLAQIYGHNLIVEVYGEFLRLCGVDFGLTVTMKLWKLIDKGMCLLNHVQLVEFATDGLQSSSRDIQEDAKRMHLVWSTFS